MTQAAFSPISFQSTEWTELKCACGKPLFLNQSTDGRWMVGHPDGGCVFLSSLIDEEIREDLTPQEINEIGIGKVVLSVVKSIIEQRQEEALPLPMMEWGKPLGNVDTNEGEDH